MNLLIWFLDKLGIMSPNNWIGLLLGITSISIAYAISDKWYALILLVVSVAVALLVFAQGINSGWGVSIVLGVWASFYIIPNFERVLIYIGIIDEGKTCIQQNLSQNNSSGYSLPSMDDCVADLIE